MARRVNPASAPRPPVRVLGVDDWAFRRGHRYGTVLVDLERNRVVDLLPDRQAETFAIWLKANPTIEVVARDRAGAYADGARRGAPTAVQVTDRWHLLRNLGDAVQTAAERHHAAVWHIGESVLAEHSEAVPLPAAKEVRPGAAEQRSQTARARRQSRFEEAARLHEAGMTISEIARRLGIDRKTTRRWLHRGSPPSWRPGASRGAAPPSMSTSRTWSGAGPRASTTRPGYGATWSSSASRAAPPACGPGLAGSGKPDPRPPDHL